MEKDGLRCWMSQGFLWVSRTRTPDEWLVFNLRDQTVHRCRGHLVPVGERIAPHRVPAWVFEALRLRGWFGN
jgi:hypothetical protein